MLTASKHAKRLNELIDIDRISLVHNSKGHSLRSTYSPSNIIQILEELLSNPNQVKESNHFGELPLHIAVSQINGSYSIIKKIIDIFPEACYTENKNGNLPIHLLCLRAEENSKHLIPTLKLIISIAPACINMKNKIFRIKQSPIEIAYNKRNLVVVTVLINFYSVSLFSESKYIFNPNNRSIINTITNPTSFITNPMAFDITQKSILFNHCMDKR